MARYFYLGAQQKEVNRIKRIKVVVHKRAQPDVQSDWMIYLYWSDALFLPYLLVFLLETASMTLIGEMAIWLLNG